MDIVQLFALAGTPLLAAALIAVLHRPITRVGLVDTPDHRKLHDGAIPLAGGPAMALAFAAMLLASGAWYPHYEGLLVATALLCVIGIGSEWLFASFLLLIAVHMIVVSNAWRIARWLRRQQPRFRKQRNTSEPMASPRAASARPGEDSPPRPTKEY